MRLSADRLRILRERVLLFDGFSDEDILALLDYSDRRGLVDGEVVVDEGESPPCSSSSAVMQLYFGSTMTALRFASAGARGDLRNGDARYCTAVRRVVAKGMVLLVMPVSSGACPGQYSFEVTKPISDFVRRLRLANRRWKPYPPKLAWA